MEMEAARCWLVIGDWRWKDNGPENMGNLELGVGVRGRGCLYTLGSSGELATKNRKMKLSFSTSVLLRPGHGTTDQKASGLGGEGRGGETLPGDCRCGPFRGCGQSLARFWCVLTDSHDPVWGTACPAGGVNSALCWGCLQPHHSPGGREGHHFGGLAAHPPCSFGYVPLNHDLANLSRSHSSRSGSGSTSSTWTDPGKGKRILQNPLRCPAMSCDALAVDEQESGLLQFQPTRRPPVRRGGNISARGAHAPPKLQSHDSTNTATLVCNGQSASSQPRPATRKCHSDFQHTGHGRSVGVGHGPYRRRI
jgi:hypothetical protein